MSEIIEDILTLLTLGGPIVVILLVTSALGLALALHKFLQFSKASESTLQRLYQAVEQWHKGKTERALDIFDKSPLTIAGDLKFVLEQHTTTDSDYLYDESLRRCSEFLREYAKNLRLLELIYTLAPVLGLLGTVLGMIDAFQGLASNAGSVAESTALAGGIWEALLTTAVGLSVAICFAILHALLEAKLEALTNLVNDVFSRALTLPALS